MALKLPTHSIDAEMTYISRADDSWDHDRIERESADLDEDEKHPVLSWLDCEYRFDLSASMPLGDSEVSIGDYLDGKPTLFVLQRMHPRDYGRLEARMSRMIRQAQERKGSIDEEDFFEFCYEAVRLGLRDVRDGGFSVRYRPGRPVSEDDMGKLGDLGGRALIEEIGSAAFRASGPLSESEKKR